MKVRIALVDDLKQDREHLESCINDFFEARSSDAFSLDIFKSAEAFLPTFSKGKYDLVFLDICMDEMNGIELAKELRVLDTQLMIVFQTTAREYAFDAFPIHPFDYLIKPCRQDEMNSVLDEAMRVLSAGDPVIRVLAARTEYDVPLRSVIAASSSGHNTELALTNNQHITAIESFKIVSAKLQEDKRFLLINRGIMVNMDQVLSPKDGAMHMKDGSSYPIKVNGRASILSEFSQYMISKVDNRR